MNWKQLNNNIQFYAERDGKFYDSNYKVVKKDNPKAKSGVVKRAWDSTWDKLSGEKSSQVNSGDALKESSSSSNHDQDYKTKNPKPGINEDSFDHDELPSSDSKESITENSLTSKICTIRDRGARGQRSEP